MSELAVDAVVEGAQVAAGGAELAGEALEMGSAAAPLPELDLSTAGTAVRDLGSVALDPEDPKDIGFGGLDAPDTEPAAVADPADDHALFYEATDVNGDGRPDEPAREQVTTTYDNLVPEATATDGGPSSPDSPISPTSGEGEPADNDVVGPADERRLDLWGEEAASNGQEDGRSETALPSPDADRSGHSLGDYLRSLPPHTLTEADEVDLAHSIRAGVLARGITDDAASPDDLAWYLEAAGVEEDRIAQLSTDGAAARARLTEALTEHLGKAGIPDDTDLDQLQVDGAAARAKLIEENLRLVPGIAKRYQRANPSTDIHDLIQEGNIGIIQAADRFTPGKGAKFSTYGALWVNREIMRSLPDARYPFHVPTDVELQARKLQRVQREYQDRGEQATDQQLMKEAEINTVSRLETLLALNDLMSRTVSLDETVEGGEGGETTVGALETHPDQVPVAEQATDHVLRHAQHLAIMSALGTLTEQEQRAVVLVYGLDDGSTRENRKQAEVGEMMASNNGGTVTGSRVGQLVRAGLGKLGGDQTGNRLFAVYDAD